MNRKTVILVASLEQFLFVFLRGRLHSHGEGGGDATV